MQQNNSPTWRQIHHELMSPLAMITGRTQLLQRQILRADGLTTLERDQLLGNVVAVLGALQTLETRLGAMLPPGVTSSGLPEPAVPPAPPQG